MDKENETTISAKELEEEIIEFLNEMSSKSGGRRTKPGCNLIHGKACALATCVDNKPRVTPVDFFNEGMTIWIAGEPGGKIANIKRNPEVALTIYVPVDHSVAHKSLQLWGKAQLINLKNNPEEFRKRMAAFGIEEAGMGVIEEFVQFGGIPKGQEKEALEMVFNRSNLIKIMPEKIVLLHMRLNNLPLKKTWENGKATIKKML